MGFLDTQRWERMLQVLLFMSCPLGEDWKRKTRDTVFQYNGWTIRENRVIYPGKCWQGIKRIERRPIPRQRIGNVDE